MHFHTRTLSSVFVLFLFSKNIILFTHSPVKLKRQRHTTNIQINKYANCSPRFPFRFRPAVRFELISLSFRLVSFRQFGKRFESVCMLSLYSIHIRWAWAIRFSSCYAAAAVLWSVVFDGVAVVPFECHHHHIHLSNLQASYANSKFDTFSYFQNSIELI